ncbi:MAG: potassium channel family protein [Candidatus Komeilibacteria bacterium]
MLTFLYTAFRFWRSLFRGFRDPEFKGLFLLVLIILITGTIFYHSVEKWRYLDSLYFSVTTLTTVGYGDLAPHTDLGKIFTMIYLFVGIGIILGFVNAVAAHHSDEPTPRLSNLWCRRKK